jgi:5-methylcytosine-specific restriction protein A
MLDLLQDVLDNFLSTKARLFGRANVVGAVDQSALLTAIPARIEQHLASRGKADLFKVKGSIGNGNIARVPWVGIFRTSITQNAENGYYIVLLFSEDMSACYLSLNQGITAVQKMYTKVFALRKMQDVAYEAKKYLNIHPEAIQGKIDLKSTASLGRGYESAAIESFRYHRDDLPSNERFFSDLDFLLNEYAQLEKIFKSDLYSLLDVSEEEFQQVALEKAALQSQETLIEASLSGGIAVGSASVLGTKGFVRSPIVSAVALRNANFTCEIDQDHWTFISKAKKQKYVEAHHLIPICHQNKFEYSLDVVANIISLCATCHRMLHFGAAEEKRPLLKSLLKKRRKNLLERSIKISDDAFLALYGNAEILE